MLFCKPCQQRKSWPESTFRSLGHCGVCGSPSVECYDVPSSQLPLLPVQEENASDLAATAAEMRQRREALGQPPITMPGIDEPTP